jgi:hypothetical protein
MQYAFLRALTEERMTGFKTLLVLGSIATLAGASRAQAQFTTFIPPQTVVQDSASRAVAVADSVKAVADTSTAVAITNMKTWVDSAAGIASPPITPLPDSTTLAESTTFVNGARAPETASDLPLLLLVGTAALLGGLLLLGGREPRRPRA